ncbi:Uncharacterised protein [Bordetella pertussis]|nr:Uncharacterised protein [Bordetella pertussis]
MTGPDRRTKATRGRPTPNACRPPAWTGRSTRTWRTTTTTIRWPAFGSTAPNWPAARPGRRCASAP